MGFCRDDFGSLGVPQNQVCVSAHGDAPLPGVAVEDLGSIGTGHRYKIVLVHLPGDLGKRREEGPSLETHPAPGRGQQPRPRGRTPREDPLYDRAAVMGKREMWGLCLVPVG